MRDDIWIGVMVVDKIDVEGYENFKGCVKNDSSVSGTCTLGVLLVVKWSGGWQVQEEDYECHLKLGDAFDTFKETC